MTNEEQRELFNERAAIREFDGGMPRADAERMASEDVERHRHRCEVRTILRKYAAEGISGVDQFIELVAKIRGDSAAARLREDAIAQWKAGNRGNEGDWRELGLK